MTIAEQLIEKKNLEIDHDNLCIRVRISTDLVKYQQYSSWVLGEINNVVGAWIHAKRISGYRVFTDRLTSACQLLASRDDFSEVIIVVCQGWPFLPQISLNVESPARPSVLLQIAGSEKELQEIKSPWMIEKIKRDLENLAIDRDINTAQLEAALLRARVGAFPAVGERLHLVRKRSKIACSAPWRVVKNGLRNCVEVYIYDILSLNKPEELSTLLNTTHAQLSSLHGSLPLTSKIELHKRVRRQIEEALCGAQSLRLDMPMVLLAGICLPIHNLEEKLGKADGWVSHMEGCLIGGNRFVDQFTLVDIKQGTVEKTLTDDPFFVQLYLNRLAEQSLGHLGAKQRQFQATTLVINSSVFKAMCQVGKEMKRDVIEILKARANKYKAFDFTPYALTFHAFPVTRPSVFKRKKTPDPCPPWLVSVLREMVAMDEFYDDPSWIRDRLCLSLDVADIQDAMQMLKKLEWIRWDSGGRKWYRVKDNMLTPETVKGERVQNYYRSVFALSSWSIVNVPVGDQQIESAIIPLDEDTLAAFVPPITSAMQKLLHLEEEASLKTSVYQVNCCLMPLPSSATAR